MNCPSCGVEVMEGSLFCHQCGAKLSQPQGTPDSNSLGAAQSGESVELESSQAGQAEGIFPGLSSESAGLGQAVLRPTPAPPEEQELWKGGYSGRDMYETWVLYALITLGLLVICLWARTSWVSWASVILVILMWFYGMLVLAYRKLSVAYRLTNRRFFHEKGILRRVTDRIELIDIDDITVEQSIIDRLVGVGTLKITSSDRTHPELILPGIKDARQVADLIDNARLQERRRRGIHIETV